MLDFYTDLNNARKEKDDSYADLNHIGEEVNEPDEAETKSHSLYDSEAKTHEEQKESSGLQLGEVLEASVESYKASMASQ